MDQVISREWKKVRKFVLFFFFLYNNKSYIFGDLDYVKNRYFKDNDRIYILLDINQFPAGDQCSAFLWGVYD